VDDILDSSQDSSKPPATYPALYGLEASSKMAIELVEKAIQDIEFLGSRGETLTELARFISVRRI
jgi:geranylgeranyl diphosphate synthase type II